MVTSVMWYIDEGFLVWIIPLRYQSHEFIYRARTTSFVSSVYPIIWCLIHVRVYDHDTISNACFWFRFIDAHVLVLARHLAFTTRWGVSDSPGSSCPDPEAWSLSILPVWSEMRSRCVDHRPTIWVPSFQAPLFGSRVFPLWLLSAFCTVHCYISLCILAFVPISDVIFL